MTIIDQDELLNKIDSFNVENFPNTILIDGEEGSGKHLIANYISEKLHKSIIDITDKLTLDTIIEIGLSPVGNIYLINCNGISVKEQNTILKFIEEPNSLSTIILIVENKNQLLQTIQNRCFTLHIMPYTRESLKKFIPESLNENIIDYVTTPGQLQSLSNEQLDETINLAETIINKLDIANIGNILTIPSKFVLTKKDDESKLNFRLLLKILSKKLVEKYELTSDNKYINAYTCVGNTLTKTYSNCDKQRLFDNFLIDLKFILKK